MNFGIFWNSSVMKSLLSLLRLQQWNSVPSQTGEKCYPYFLILACIKTNRYFGERKKIYNFSSIISLMYSNWTFALHNDILSKFFYNLLIKGHCHLIEHIHPTCFIYYKLFFYCGYALVGFRFRCDFCFLNCTSKIQWAYSHYILNTPDIVLSRKISKVGPG